VVVVVETQLAQLACLLATSAATLTLFGSLSLRGIFVRACPHLLRLSGRFHIQHRARYWPIIAGLKHTGGP